MRHPKISDNLVILDKEDRLVLTGTITAITGDLGEWFEADVWDGTEQIGSIRADSYRLFPIGRTDQIGRTWQFRFTAPISDTEGQT